MIESTNKSEHSCVCQNDQSDKNLENVWHFLPCARIRLTSVLLLITTDITAGRSQPSVSSCECNSPCPPPRYSERRCAFMCLRGSHFTLLPIITPEYAKSFLILTDLLQASPLSPSQIQIEIQFSFVTHTSVHSTMCSEMLLTTVHLSKLSSRLDMK